MKYTFPNDAPAYHWRFCGVIKDFNGERCQTSIFSTASRVSTARSHCKLSVEMLLLSLANVNPSAIGQMPESWR
jgi:hypothetical protein